MGAAVLGANAALLPQLLDLSSSPTPLEALAELGSAPLADAFTLLAAMSLGIAILRYRLGDIDLVINRPAAAPVDRRNGRDGGPGGGYGERTTANASPTRLNPRLRHVLTRAVDPMGTGPVVLGARNAWVVAPRGR
jgi:hypothetical protein